MTSLGLKRRHVKDGGEYDRVGSIQDAGRNSVGHVLCSDLVGAYFGGRSAEAKCARALAEPRHPAVMSIAGAVPKLRGPWPEVRL